MLALLGVALLAGCGAQSSPSSETRQAADRESQDGTTAEAPASSAKNEKKPAELGSPRYLTVTLDEHEGAQNVGLLMAQKLGYFHDAHLILSLLLPLSPARPVHYVANGLDDLGVAQEPQVVLERARGAQVAAVGSLISQPTAALIWLGKSQITSIADLKGKTIAIPGSAAQKAFLEDILKQAGLAPADVTIESVRENLVPALVSGRADAIFGGSWNLEGVELEDRGLKPVIKRVHSLGIPDYDEFVVVARSDRLAENPGVMRDFMKAVIRGNVAAAKDPRAAVNAIMEADLGNFVPRRKKVEAEVAATLPLLSKNGYMNPKKAAQLTDWMYEEGMIQHKPPVSKVLANNYR